MTANRVIEHLDVIKNIRRRRLPRGIDPALDALLFQRPEEALGHGIVVAVTTSTHARDHAVLFQERLPVTAGELAALVGVDHDARLRLAPPHGGQQRL